jgi:hypothetical protein
MTLQEAVHEAMEAWSAGMPKTRAGDLDALEGSLADVDIEALRRSENQLELESQRLAR